MDNKVWWNGRIVPVNEVCISATDYGFLYGYGLFETLRSYQGKPYLLVEHINRLKHGTEALGIRIDSGLMAQAVIEVLVENSITEGRIRLTVSAGEGSLRPDLQTCAEPTVLVMAVNYQPPPDDIYRRGYHIITSDITRNHHSPLNIYKTADYLEYVAAINQARKAGYDEALLLNDRGKLAECSTGNIFLVKRGKLVTPGTDSGILPGITRQTVLAIAREMNIGVKEGEVSANTLNSADEAFLTNSLMEIMPLTAVDGKAIGDGNVGKLTADLQTAYKKKVTDTLMLSE